MARGVHNPIDWLCSDKYDMVGVSSDESPYSSPHFKASDDSLAYSVIHTQAPLEETVSYQVFDEKGYILRTVHCYRYRMPCCNLAFISPLVTKCFNTSL